MNELQFDACNFFYSFYIIDTGTIVERSANGYVFRFVTSLVDCMHITFSPMSLLKYTTSKLKFLLILDIE